MSLTSRNAFILIAAAVSAAISALAVFDPMSLASIVVLPGMLLVGIWLWRLLHGDQTAVVILLFIAIFMVDAVFRRREATDKSLDFQALMKIGLWALLVVVSLLNLRKWYHLLILPSNVPGVMFLLWICATTLTSHVPAYTAVTSFSIMAYALGSAYFCNVLKRSDLFGAIVAAITLFCFISILYYFIIPEYGRYTYWHNKELYLSARLAGISGSANNMGRIASVGLILLAMYAKDFRRYNPLFVPVSALIMGVALVLTNSRSSLAMVLVLLMMVYAFNARRFYLLVLAGSAAALLLVLLIPFADQILTSVARTGNMEEITSLTGRTGVWRGVLELSAQKPVAGWGYASSIFVLPEHEPVVGFYVPHAHNLFLQLLLTTGWTGVILFTLAVLCIGARASFARDRTVITLLAIVLLNGIVEASGFTTLANICTLAFTIAMFLPPEGIAREDHPSYQRRFS